MNTQKIFIAFCTILNREIRRFCRIWPQTLLPPAITMSLYFIIFGGLIGSRVGQMGGVSYMQYIVPGLIMMSVITNAYTNVASSFFSAKFQRSIEELLISPIPNYIILLGFVLGGVARGIAVGIIVTLLSLFFTKLGIHNLLIASVVIVLTSILFALGGFINAIYANKFDDISIIPTFVLTPLTYLGGVFYSITELSKLSEFWQQVAYWNPILYMVNLFRYGILGIADTDLMLSLVMLVTLTVVLFLTALYLLRRGVGLRQ